MMRAGSGLCAGRESVLNAVPEGGSAVGLTATIGPGTVVRWVLGGPGPCLKRLSPHAWRLDDLLGEFLLSAWH
jgi:hypothetical protein